MLNWGKHLVDVAARGGVEPFLACVAHTGKPIIVLTGMSGVDDLKVAVRTIEEAGNTRLVVLHCVSAYLASPVDANFQALDTVSTEFNVPVR